MTSLRDIISSFNHLFFPHLCAGCGSDLLNKNELVCFKCMSQLPYTNFENIRNNRTEQIFQGRIQIESAMSLLYFSKYSAVQNLMHQLKYKGQKQLGIFLGTLIGKAIQQAPHFQNIHGLIPLPLFPEKEKIRGYNQSELLCNGISEITSVPVLSNNIIRQVHTSTQTRKHRRERWQNVEGIFHISDPETLINKHLLLVDDVITTGATLESCAINMKEIPGVTISIATLAIALH